MTKGSSSQFKNLPLLDFSIPEVRNNFQKAIGEVENKILLKQFTAKPYVAGKWLTTRNKISSLDPASPAISVGDVYLAEVSDAKAAIKFHLQSGDAWQFSDPSVRIKAIEKTGSIMTERRYELAALLVREVGKPWKEADGDVVEAIDFCFYYAAQYEKLSTPQKTQELLGEDNFYLYKPRGIGVVIAPWNFPLAIACGMTVASLITGNCTILKPAEQSSLIAAEFSKILIEAGIPNYAYSFLPGLGETVGRSLVEDPAVDLIAFTGSKNVGLEILKAASIVHPEQRSFKKVITELGGKNALIIDDDADADEAIKGILHSAFGYAGQKCSACSRLICVGDIYEPLLERLSEAAKSIIINKPQFSDCGLGPVIDDEAYSRLNNVIQSVIQTAKNSGEKSIVDITVPSEGYFIPPTIFRDVSEDSLLWKNELFGPILACMKVGSLKEAVEVANRSPYALTGGLYSRHPDHIEYTKQKFLVGNLYINRGITGAIVERQPFGGFRMSGIGSKAGGPDYLIQFMEPRTITENTTRRGFAPVT